MLSSLKVNTVNNCVYSPPDLIFAFIYTTPAPQVVSLEQSKTN